MCLLAGVGIECEQAVLEQAMSPHLYRGSPDQGAAGQDAGGAGDGVRTHTAYQRQRWAGPRRSVRLLAGWGGYVCFVEITLRCWDSERQ